MSDLKPSDVAKMLKKSVKTIQRWDNDGILVAKRTPKGRRYYTMQQLIDFKKQNGEQDMNTELKVLYGDCELFDKLIDNKSLQQQMEIYYSAYAGAFVCTEETLQDLNISKEIQQALDNNDIFISTFSDFLDEKWEYEDGEIDLNFGVGGGRNPSFGVSLSQWGEEATEETKGISELAEQEDWYVYTTLGTRSVMFDVMLDAIKSSMRFYRENMK